MTERKSLTKTVRFEVYKRDSFACQYCGRKSPDILLQVDYIEPVTKGGTNDLLNLITSCKDCNAGQSDKHLSNSTVLEKRRKLLEELQERKEQIEMMIQWQKSLLELNDPVTDQLSEYWSEVMPGFSLRKRNERI
jgi:5-methylcytosine-specific restriction endonuclease McrA